MDHTPPIFNFNEFDPTRDRVADWLVQEIPWRRIELTKLHRREEFLPGSGWGRNSWGELYKGDSAIHFYAAVPETLVAQCNLQLAHQNQVMHILQGARPDFTRPRGWQKPEQMAYFRWMGVSM